MRDTEWFAKCGWGVFCHYLTAPETSADAWNRRVDGFSVAGLAAQLAEVKARHFFITVGQGSGHYVAPNETYDRITGIRPSKCSKRDLVSDLSEQLRARGIELLAYVPAHGPSADAQAREGLKMSVHWNDELALDWRFGPHWAKYRLPESQRAWIEVCRDWSRRFGRKIRGWWVDGAYAREHVWPEDGSPNLSTFAEALRSGNPDAILAFNPGVSVPVIHYTEQEDYTCGEIANALPECPGAFVTTAGGHKARYHTLSYLGQSWCSGLPRFPDELVVGYTKHVISKGGAVTWDVPIEPSGLIPDAFVRQLRVIGDSLGKGWPRESNG